MDLTINEWCRRHRVCRATFYNLKKRGLAPQMIRVGNRDRIPEEYDRAWVERMRAEAQAVDAA